MNALNRRGLIGAGLTLGAVAASSAAETQPAPLFDAGRDAQPDDQAFWRSVAAQYDLPPGVVQLENGNYGAMARPVLEAYTRHLQTVNTDTSYYTRRGVGADMARVRARVAADLGVDVEEIAFTRGATESLMTLIAGYNRLKPGDQVLYADLDYDSMQAGFRWLKGHRGVGVVAIDLPEPATYQGVLDAYEQALVANPKVRLMLLTQVSHRTGLALPVAEIMEIARRHGVDVILDAAHAWGQLDFKLPDLKADFVGLTCQKWMGAPLGVGVMYVRKARLGDIDTAIGVEPGEADGINRRIHTGTSNFAGYLALEQALDFHQRIGARAKARRLRHLRDRWAEAVRGLGRIEVLTPADPRLTCAITSFRLKGAVTEAENRALAADLLKRFDIFTVERSGVAKGACVRVTPGVFTLEADVDQLIAALKTLA